MIERVASRLKAFEGYISRLTAPTARTSDPEIFNFQSMPYGGTWYLLLVRIARRLDARAGTKPALTMGTIKRYYAQRMIRVGFERRVRAALDQASDVIAESSPPSAKSDRKSTRLNSSH